MHYLLPIVIVLVSALGGLYYLQSAKTTPEGKSSPIVEVEPFRSSSTTSISTPGPSPTLKTLPVDPLYTQLSEGSDYIFYGSVQKDLGGTREEKTDHLGTFGHHYNHYSVEVFDSAFALGGNNSLPPLSSVITLRIQATSAAPKIIVGQQIVGFIKIREDKPNTYNPIYQPIPVYNDAEGAYIPNPIPELNPPGHHPLPPITSSDTKVSVKEFLNSLTRR